MNIKEALDDIITSGINLGAGDFVDLEALEVAARVLEKMQWISIYDKLPEAGERVLTTDGAFVGEMYINKRGQWQRYNVANHADLMALDILWWMPLPDAPKEVNDGRD